MAVLSSLKVEIRIPSTGSLGEFKDSSLVGELPDNEVFRYVDFKPSNQFTIYVAALPEYEFNSKALAFWIELNGQHVHTEFLWDESCTPIHGPRIVDPCFRRCRQPLGYELNDGQSQFYSLRSSC